MVVLVIAEHDEHLEIAVYACAMQGLREVLTSCSGPKAEVTDVIDRGDALCGEQADAGHGPRHIAVPVPSQSYAPSHWTIMDGNPDTRLWLVAPNAVRIASRDEPVEELSSPCS